MRYASCPSLVGIQILIAALAFVAIIAYCSVSANPIIPRSPPDTTFRLTDPVSGIAWLIFVNFLVNIACYCGALLAVTKKFLGKADMLRTTGFRFLGALLCVVLVITIVGAFADFYLVAQPRYIDGIYNAAGEDISGTYRVFVFDALVWALALASIIAAVGLASILILQMFWRASVIVAVTMATLNLIAWLLVGVLGEDIVFLSIMFSIMLAPVLVGLLIRWYAEGMPEKRTPQAA